MSRTIAIVLVVSAATALGAGCSSAPPDETAAEDAPPVLWKEGAGDYVAAVEPDEEAALDEAFTRARETADDARRDWEVTAPERRRDWAVKWAAPTEAGATEFVWVVPEAWSPFRVEGILVNQPINALACAKQLGDRVSFPIEELADWVFLLTGDLDGPRRGGFTLELLEERFGTPRGEEGERGEGG